MSQLAERTAKVADGVLGLVGIVLLAVLSVVILRQSLVADGVVILHQGRFGGHFRMEDLTSSEDLWQVEIEGDPQPFVATLATQNMVVDAGAVEVPGRRLRIEATGQFDRTEDIGELGGEGRQRVEARAPDHQLDRDPDRRPEADGGRRCRRPAGGRAGRLSDGRRR